MKRLAIIFFCSITLWGCTGNVDSGALRSFVKEKLKGDKGTLDFSAYKDLAWDKVYILGPYTNERIFDGTLKTYKKDILATGVDTETGICLVMLFNGDKMVTQSVFDRKNIDFNNLIKFTTNTLVMPYKRTQAIFRYTKQSKYSPYIVSENRYSDYQVH